MYLILKLSDQSKKCTRLNFHGSVIPEKYFKDPKALTAFLLPFNFLLNFSGKGKKYPFYHASNLS